MKLRIPFILLLCVVLIPCAMTQSGSEAAVNGKIVEASTGEPMEFVNVVLFDSAAENQLQGTVTDEEGKFSFKGLGKGDYLVEASFIGFETQRTELFTIREGEQSIDLPDIGIEINSNLLEEVEVTGERSTYSFDIDRKIYNVEKDIMSQTSSAVEILQNLPSIDVSIDGQVSLRGTSNITFFINGRPSALMRANSAAALQSIPANSIERIEVITNPSAKYRPDGVGGIINIVLKKEVRKGFNGVVLGNVGNLQRYNANLSLNYGQGDMNMFGSYGVRSGQTPREREETRINKDENGNVINTTVNKSDRNTTSFSHVANAGMNFPIGEKTQVELSGNYYRGNEDVQTHSDWLMEDEFPSAFSTVQNLFVQEEEYELSLAVEHEVAEDQTLIFEVNHSNYDEKEDTYFETNYTFPNESTTLNHLVIEKGGPLTEMSLEYARPIGEESELELGYVAEFLNDDISNLGEDFDGQENEWVIDPNKTNNFLFTQHIHAFYTTFGRSIGKFSFLAGLRAEQALVTSHQITNDIIIPNDYFKLYPTLHLSYELGEEQELQFNYSKRVNRADSDEHNPYPEYKDPRYSEAGNPLIKPEQIHSMELGYRLQKEDYSFIPSLYYRYKYDAFEEITQIVDDTIVQTTFANLANETSAGLEMILTGNIREVIGVVFSVNGYYNEIDASNLGLSSSRGAFSWDSKLALNVHISKSTFGQLNAQYRSARITAQGEVQPRVLLNLGLRQDVMKNRGSIILTISDVFASLERRSIIDTPELYQNTITQRNRQIVYLGFNYRFGGTQKSDRKNLIFEDRI